MHVLELRLDPIRMDFLRRLRSLWPKIISSHQEKILQEARDIAERVGGAPRDTRGLTPERFAINAGCSPADRARLEELAELWQVFRMETCQKLLDQAQWAAGSLDNRGSMTQARRRA